MSRKSKYKCKKCGYATDIYEGRGFMGQHIEAMTCPDCHNIVPLVVGGVIGDAAPSFNSLVGRLCLRCGSDRIHLWDHHTCPRCGGEMQPTGDSEFLDVRSQPFFCFFIIFTLNTNFSVNLYLGNKTVLQKNAIFAY